MRKTIACSALLLAPLAASSCSSASTAGNAGDGGNGVDGGTQSDGASATPATAHGQMVDYFTLKPVAGLSVSAGGATTTTDATGKWTLSVTTGMTLEPHVTGPSYTNLIFPSSTANDADVDFEQQVIPDTSAFTLEEQSIASDPAKALVHIVVAAIGSCASAVGGTVKVAAPAGASTIYFASSAFPDASLTSFQDVKAPRPVAVVFNVAPDAVLDIQIEHPTCKQVALPTSYKGKILSNKSTLKGTEPGGYNSALFFLLQ
jgi:hypothetical protein